MINVHKRKSIMQIKPITLLKTSYKKNNKIHIPTKHKEVGRFFINKKKAVPILYM